MSDPFTKRLGIDTQSLFGMPPLDHVALAGKLGMGHVSMSLTPLPWKLDVFPDWSLRDTIGMRRDFVSALAANDIFVSQMEGFSVRAGKDVREMQGDLDIIAEMGARNVSGVCMERDMARALDQFGQLADLAGERGMGLAIEFAPPHALGTLDRTVAAVRQLDRANIGIIIDAMHFFRSGSDHATLAALDPALIVHFQMCDVPMQPTSDNYFDEACHERLIPGEGELPLAALIAALPDTVPVALEIPMRSRITGPDSLGDWMAAAATASSALLRQAASRS